MYSFDLYMACGGIFSFRFITFNFFMSLLLHKLERQSEDSGFRSDTSSLVQFYP